MMLLLLIMKCQIIHLLCLLANDVAVIDNEVLNNSLTLSSCSAIITEILQITFLIKFAYSKMRMNISASVFNKLNKDGNKVSIAHKNFKIHLLNIILIIISTTRKKSM